jgi:hypothetical protein
MFDKMLMAECDNNDRRAVAAKPDGLVRAAHTGELGPMEMPHV